MDILAAGRDGKLVVIVMEAVLVRASVGHENVTVQALSVEDKLAKELVSRWQTAPGIQCPTNVHTQRLMTQSVDSKQT